MMNKQDNKTSEAENKCVVCQWLFTVRYDITVLIHILAVNYYTTLQH